MRRPGLLAAALLLLIGGSARAADTDDSLRHCVRIGSVLPLLGGGTDTPLVKVTVNGKTAAMFVSPEIAWLIVRNVSKDFRFPNEGWASLVAQDDRFLDAYWTRIGTLDIDQFRITDGEAAQVDLNFPRSVSTSGGDLPIIGIIGRNILFHNLIELIDMPHRYVAFFEWDHDHCGEASRILGENARTIAISEDNAVDGAVAGAAFDIHFNPDLAYSTFPRDEISRIGLKRKVMKTWPKVDIRYSRTDIGYLSDPMDVAVGGKSIGPQRFVIEDDGIPRVVLGNPFFRTRAVLFDFTRGKMAYADSPPSGNATVPSGHLHFDMSFVPQASVSDSQGTIERGSR